jgi:hypothetical protein
VKDQPYGTIDDLIAEIAHMSIAEIRAQIPPDRPHLITRDQLLAAGALNLNPPGRRKLQKPRKGETRQLDLFAEQPEDDEAASQDSQSDAEDEVTDV